MSTLHKGAVCVRLPDPPLLLVTDRRQARRPLAAIVARRAWRRLPLGQPARKGFAGGRADYCWRGSCCRWPVLHGARLTAARRGDARQACRHRRRAPALRREAGGRPRADRAAKTHRRLDPHRNGGRGDRSGATSTTRWRAPPSRRRASPATARRSAARDLPRSRAPRAFRCSPSAASMRRASPK